MDDRLAPPSVGDYEKAQAIRATVSIADQALASRVRNSSRSIVGEGWRDRFAPSSANSINSRGALLGSNGTGRSGPAASPRT